MIATSLIGTGLGAYQTVSSAQQASEAKKALENFNRQELKNVAKNLAPSTLGAELRQESQAQLSANQVDALRGGGARAIIGGAGRVEAGNQAVNADIAANLDEQQKAIDRLVAQDDAAIRGLQENRELNDISALSSQYNAANQNMMMGIGNAVQSAGMLANNITTPEGSARRDAWRDYKKSNPNAKRSDFMKANPKSGFAYNNYPATPSTGANPAFQVAAPAQTRFTKPPVDMTDPQYVPMEDYSNPYGNYNYRRPIGGMMRRGGMNYYPN